jgi:hypothetical protein
MKENRCKICDMEVSCMIIPSNCKAMLELCEGPFRAQLAEAMAVPKEIFLEKKPTTASQLLKKPDLPF